MQNKPMCGTLPFACRSCRSTCDAWSANVGNDCMTFELSTCEHHAFLCPCPISVNESSLLVVASAFLGSCLLLRFRRKKDWFSICGFLFHLQELQHSKKGRSRRASFRSTCRWHTIPLHFEFRAEIWPFLIDVVGVQRHLMSMPQHNEAKDSVSTVRNIETLQLLFLLIWNPLFIGHKISALITPS